jgi:apolipoprotein N-acyltransferase
MSIPQQEPQPIKTKEHKQLQEKHFLVAVIAVLFLVGGAVLWILNAQGIVQGSWSSLLLIIFTVLGVVIGLFQWLFPVTEIRFRLNPYLRLRRPDFPRLPR